MLSTRKIVLISFFIPFSFYTRFSSFPHDLCIMMLTTAHILYKCYLGSANPYWSLSRSSSQVSKPSLFLLDKKYGKIFMLTSTMKEKHHQKLKVHLFRVLIHCVLFIQVNYAGKLSPKSLSVAKCPYLKPTTKKITLFSSCYY